MMWNHTRNQALRVHGLEQILANQEQTLRSGSSEGLLHLLTESCMPTPEILNMVAKDRNAHTDIPHANRDNPGTYN
eukprot:3560278-Amphidinium_carterae.1